MAEVPQSVKQFVGKADASRMKLSEQAGNKEAGMSPEQQQFFNKYQTELKHAQESDMEAATRARDRMKGLTAPELRRVGVKQLLWGWGLSVFNWIGGGLGALGGIGLSSGMFALSQAVGSGTVATALGVAALAPPVVGAIGGLVAGAELAGYIYSKYVRKYDKELPKLDKLDWIAGGVLSVTSVVNPPMIAGARNVLEGFNQLKILNQS